MTLTKVTGKEIYDFCRNSPYYQMVVEYINREINVQEEVDQKKKEDIQKIKNACNSFSNDFCLIDNTPGEEICKKFFCMYKYLDDFYYLRDSKSTLTNEDFDFMNYWLNVKLKGGKGNSSICINEFNRKIKNESENFISSKKKLEKDLHVIDPDNLENMELLFELYNNERIILNMMRGQDYPDEKKKSEEEDSEEKKNEKQKSCSDYIEDCSKKYEKAMDKCLNDNTDFYKALNDFKISYNYAVERETKDLRNCKSSPYFYLPKYDPVVGRQRNIMAGKLLSVPLILSFVIPLLYKYTPLGPFLRTKINIAKNRWINSDEYGNELSSLPTYIEDNISDSGEYNIGYYSGTN
ncbi:PIR Superfamily Protein [Plasmodium ovale curtisi]|uniref:PIR Superfamily Protein n=1 Tax=Plasmodium ovale curtisi TaxID=864141 RepID=A0A1A8WMF8_PLAOA|nr:PIR Superfamily Protein [Plasmodium ovale curtisi]